MNETEQLILQIATIYKNPDEFIRRLEELPILQNKKGEFFLEVGVLLYEFSYFHLALKSLNHALEYFIEKNDKLGESKCYMNLSYVYIDLKDFRGIIENCERLLRIMRENGDRDGESMCYMNIGTAYYNLKNFRKAIRHYEKSLEIAKEIGDRDGESKCYANLGAAL